MKFKVFITTVKRHDNGDLTETSIVRTVYSIQEAMELLSVEYDPQSVLITKIHD